MKSLASFLGTLSPEERERAERNLLERGEELDAFPLTFAQERLWFIDRLQPGAATFNMPAAVRVDGALDGSALERSLGEIVARHEMLRTTFGEVRGRALQLIGPPEPTVLPRIDLSALPAARRQAEARHLGEREARRPFDLETGPLLRVTLLRLGARDHVVLTTFHHIACDGWSIGLFIQELGAFYESLRDGLTPALRPLSVQYADYAAWQREELAGPRLDALVAHWKSRLEGVPQGLDLPADRPRPRVRRYLGRRLPMALDPELTARLRAVALAAEGTLFMALTAGYAAILARMASRDELLLGSPVAGRGRVEIEGLIGLFVNVLVLHVDLSGDPTFHELIERVRRVSLEAFEHQDLPFEKLVEELRPERDLSRPPLVEAMLSLGNVPAERLRLPGVTLEPVAVESGTSKVDFTVELAERDGGLAGVLEYSSELYDAVTARRLAEHWRALLAAAADRPGARLSELALMSAAERHQVLREWNDTAVGRPAEPILQAVAGRAGEAPDVVAVVTDGDHLSYAELASRASRLAHALRASGIGPEERVAIALDRSVALPVALLGVLASGGAYLPLDPDHPRERLARILEDAAPVALLTHGDLAWSLPPTAARVLMIDRGGRVADPPAADRAEALDVVPAPGSALAYAIFTSGSTGRPKGVQITRDALARFLAAMAVRPGLVRGEALLAVTTPAFDISALELLLPLTVGARVEIAPSEETADARALGRRLAASRAEVLQATPATWRMLIDADWRGAPQLRALCGGEALPADLARRLGERVGELWNVYGPTESTVWAAARQVGSGESPVAVGGPIDGTRLVVTGTDLRPQPIGIPGELAIGGAGLARGYVGRPAETAAVFVPDPDAAEPGRRLYRTGDLVRRLPDGRLEFMGRFDHQVKVRGFRIELGEVELALASHPAVHEAAVTVREDAAGGSSLVAYVVGVQPGAAPAAELRSFLARRLPPYMVPGRFVALEAMPLNPSGKLDRRALPAPEPSSAGSRASLGTPAEEALAAIWCDLLELSSVGPTDDFFALGGHSLLGARLLSEVRRNHGVELALRTLFEHPTLRELAAVLERAEGSGVGPEAPPIEPTDREPPIPLSFAQERLWFLDQLRPGSSFYNEIAAVRLRGALDTGALGATFSEVVRRHEVLRTRFPAVGGRPVQAIDPPAPVPLPVVDLAGLPAARRAPEGRRVAALVGRAPFDLARGPVARFRLVRLDPEEHVVVGTLHHIACDAWSTAILIREVVALYDAFAAGAPSPLPELPIQYADYARWERGWLQGKVLDRQLAFWRRQLGGDLPDLELPTDRPRPIRPSLRGGKHTARLAPELAERLRALSRKHGTTLFMTLLAAFSVQLSRTLGEDDLLLGTAHANRGRAETAPLIGLFINMLPLRLDLGGNPRLHEVVQRVRETALGAFAHQETPLDKLVQDLRPERSGDGSPLFRMAFGVRNAPSERSNLASVEVEPFELAEETARFDLTVWVEEVDDTIEVVWRFSADLFDPPTIDRLSGDYEQALRRLVDDPDARLASVDLRSGEEQAVHERNEERWKRQQAQKLLGRRRKAAAHSTSG